MPLEVAVQSLGGSTVGSPCDVSMHLVTVRCSSWCSRLQNKEQEKWREREWERNKNEKCLKKICIDTNKQKHKATMTSSEQNTTTVRAQDPAELSACNSGVSLPLLD